MSYDLDSTDVNIRSALSTGRRSKTSQNEEGLSSRELKLKLLEAVRNNGIVDSVKSHLRNKLALQLNANIEQMKNKSSDVTTHQKARSNLALNTVNCLVINHLRSYEYDYSLSVFMPECGINLSEVYSLEDILQVLKISPESRLHSELSNSAVIKSKGLLWYLVNNLCSRYVTNEIGVQTEHDSAYNIVATLDHKLKNLEKHYTERKDHYAGKLSLEERLAAYQKQLDEKAKSELAQKMAEFRELEMAKIRLEESEKVKAMMRDYRTDLEQTYKKRYEALAVQEKAASELMKQKREMEEREIFIQRQHLLEEMKHLREKEAELRRSHDLQTRNFKVEAEKYEKLADEFKRKEALVRQAEADFQQRLRSEREQIKADLERSYAHREFVLQSVEMNNKQLASANEVERVHIDKLKSDFQYQQMRLTELDLELQKSLGEAACLRQENEMIKEKLAKCMDYDIVKEENRVLKQKLDISKELIGEKHSARFRSARSGGGSLADHPTSGGRRRSVTFAANEAGAGGPSELHLNDINEENSVMMATEMGADQLPYEGDEERSRAALRDEGERILSEAFERSEMNEKLEHHSLVNKELRDLYEMQIYEQRKLYETISDVKRNVEFLYHGVTDDGFGGGGGASSKRLLESVAEPAPSPAIDFIDTAKERLKHLEGEGERIEQVYRDYQYKIKSKYYPINDDEDNEIRIVSQKKKLADTGSFDVEKFFESTMKANMSARIMREELEADYAKHSREARTKSPAARHDVEEILRSAAPVVFAKSRQPGEAAAAADSLVDEHLLRNELRRDEADFREFKAAQQHYTSSSLSHRDHRAGGSSSPPKNTLDDYTVRKENFEKSASPQATQHDHQRSSARSSPVAKARFRPTDADRTLDSDSRAITSDKSQSSPSRSPAVSPKAKNFGVSDYLKTFEGKSNSGGGEKGQLQRAVRIEYSTSSTTHTSSDDDDTKISVNKKKGKADEDDDFW